LPSIETPLGALPARFRRTRLLIVGCGDVGLRVAARMPQSVHVAALTSSPERVAALRSQSIVPLQGNLDVPASLRRLAGWATHVVYLAPPPSHGDVDLRARAMGRTWLQRSQPRALVYGSTSGVYGDCHGEWVRETRVPAPRTARALRRLSAEAWIRLLGQAGGVRSTLLRIPGIYAPDRAGGTPHARLSKGSPVLCAQDDVYTNHIHADDLARACIAALWRGRAQRVVNVSDETLLKMGDYFDLAADLYGLPRPPRVTLAQAQAQLTPMQLSFMGESRRLCNQRMRDELKLVLRYPSVAEGLRSAGRVSP
jgi:nucleoside-diphosphate-sugar epimerase